jgi:hypothetical protein
MAPALTLNEATIDGTLELDRLAGIQMSASGATIGGQLDLQGATFTKGPP